MAKKRPKVSTIGGISREEAAAIGKRVTVPTPTPVKKTVVEQKVETVPVSPKRSKPAPPLPSSEEDPMIIVRIRKSFKKKAKSKASALDLNLYEYLEQLIENDQ